MLHNKELHEVGSGNVQIINVFMLYLTCNRRRHICVFLHTGHRDVVKRGVRHVGLIVVNSLILVEHLYFPDFVANLVNCDLTHSCK